jgi:acyl-CoA thioester hydrolase
MQRFAFVRSQPVEFRDLDGLGHVNNAVYGSYLESAKVDYFRDVVGVTRLEDLGIVADLKITFRLPAFFGETLAIGTRVSRVGTKSLQFEFEFRGADGRLVAEASSVHVAFDYGRREPTVVPDEWRRRIEAHESRDLARA